MRWIRGSFERDLDHYLPRTAHGSSLSPAIHAGLLARAGRLEEALELLDVAQGIDLHDSAGTTADGLHLAALAGLWQAVVLGFAGVRVTNPDDDALVLDPHIPTAMGRTAHHVAVARRPSESAVPERRCPRGLQLEPSRPTGIGRTGAYHSPRGMGRATSHGQDPTS